MSVPTEGAVATVDQTFTRSAVERFAELSRDHGGHHLEPDEGRLVVHGLLLATQVGGERNVTARTIPDEFRRPVYTGQSITCEVTTEAVTECEDRDEVRSRAVRSADAGTVTTAEYEGVILQWVARTDTGL